MTLVWLNRRQEHNNQRHDRTLLLMIETSLGQLYPISTKLSLYVLIFEQYCEEYLSKPI